MAARKTGETDLPEQPSKVTDKKEEKRRKYFSKKLRMKVNKLKHIDKAITLYDHFKDVPEDASLEWIEE